MRYSISYGVGTYICALGKFQQIHRRISIYFVSCIMKECALISMKFQHIVEIYRTDIIRDAIRVKKQRDVLHNLQGIICFNFANVPSGLWIACNITMRWTALEDNLENITFEGGNHGGGGIFKEVGFAKSFDLRRNNIPGETVCAYNIYDHDARLLDIHIALC